MYRYLFSNRALYKTLEQKQTNNFILMKLMFYCNFLKSIKTNKLSPSMSNKFVNNI